MWRPARCLWLLTCVMTISLLVLAPLPVAPAARATPLEQKVPLVREFNAARFTGEYTLDLPDYSVRVPLNGEFSLPDQFRLSATILNQATDIMILGDRAYVRSAFAGDPSQWYFFDSGSADPGTLLTGSASLPEEALDPRLVLTALKEITESRLLPDTQLDGAPIERHRVAINAATLKMLNDAGTRQSALGGGDTTTSGPRATVTEAYIELWVEKARRYPLQVRLHFVLNLPADELNLPGTAAPRPSPTTRPAAAPLVPTTHDLTLRFSRFEEPVRLTPPPGAIPGN